jgi:DNA-binding NarL/FixJ family response regulator
VEALRLNVHEVVASFARPPGAGRPTELPLTRRELKVAAVVRFSKAGDEITPALHTSRSAASLHRTNLRRKLGLPKGDQKRCLFGRRTVRVLEGARQNSHRKRLVVPRSPHGAPRLQGLSSHELESRIVQS